jgi:aminoglycoside 3-N-acetyltransferase
MKTITKRDIVQGLNKLGLSQGDHVIVHSSLGSFGQVTGGVKTVIDALLEVVGKDGTIMVPTFGCTDDVFDSAKSQTNLGAVPRAVWTRKQAFRSRHPLASVAAIGKQAQWLIKDHENSGTAHGVDTPYTKIAEIDGKILLLGVDQDRSTFLHAAEELAGLPYLKPEKGAYVDNYGNIRKKIWQYFPGPHRNFIGLQSWLESIGLIKKIRIGSCLAQLMPAKEMLDMLVKRLKTDPGLFISKNPNLQDAILQNADILRNMYGKESFTLAADSLFAGRYLEQIIDNIKHFGIDNILLSFVNGKSWDSIDANTRRWYLRGLKLAKINIIAIKLQTFIPENAITLLKECKTNTLIVNSSNPKEDVIKVSNAGYKVYIENNDLSGKRTTNLIKIFSKENSNISLAFNPLSFVKAGENPFLETYCKTHIKRYIDLLYINDGISTGDRTPLEQGLAEIKELISILRCRSFNGIFALQGSSAETFGETVVKFISLLKELGQ